jgi:hypothetical protein
MKGKTGHVHMNFLDDNFVPSCTGETWKEARIPGTLKEE